MKRPPEIRVVGRPQGLRCDFRPAVNGRFDVQAKANEIVIDIFDVVGDDMFGGGVTVKSIAAGLRDAGNRPVHLRLNSPGGDLFEGIAIYNVLRQHPAKVSAEIVGVAASAASLLTMAADEIAIAKNATMMVHNTWAVALGDQNVFRETADWLEGFDKQAAETYAARTGQPVPTLLEMMAVETWFNSDEAVRLGFADSMLDEDGAPKIEMAERATPKSLRGFERKLREDIGLSRNKSERVAALAWPVIAGEAEPEIDSARVTAALERNQREIKTLLQNL